MSQSIKEEKSALRKVVETRRRMLDFEEIVYSDGLIGYHLARLPEYQQAAMIFCFVSTAEEVDTRRVILDALASGKRVCVPRCASFGIMHAYEIKSMDDLQPGKYDIPEPKENCARIEPEEIDFMIIPCVTCNKKGQRLGYGGGFYDRYLEHLTQTPKAVLCRDFLLREDIPMDSHDVTIDVVVTDMGVYRPTD